MPEGSLRGDIHLNDCAEIIWPQGMSSIGCKGSAQFVRCLPIVNSSHRPMDHSPVPIFKRTFFNSIQIRFVTGKNACITG